MLKGDLIIPEGATGIVVFSHGSGSSRFSTRNKMVAELIQKKKIATLLFDLLTVGRR
jgi:predicted alpha/beta-hydrolase family hydrolase